MRRYVIERDLPAIGQVSADNLQAAARTSNAALAAIGPKIQWLESFVAADKTFCIYLAEGEATIHEHATLTGFPASRITEVKRIIDPTTAGAGV
jgi:hypothetical protein